MGNKKGVGIRHAYVLAGANDQASGDKAHFLADMEHFCEPVNSGVRIAASDAFDKRTDRVVVTIACTIIDDGFFLNALLSGGKVDAGEAVWIGRRGERGDFESVQAFSGVSITQFRKECGGVRVNNDRARSESAIHIPQGSIDEMNESFFRQWLELKNL